METRIDEGEINGAIEHVTMKQTEIILNQMKKSVCKILGTKYGTGFFCELKINNKKIPALITNYHIINDKYIESNNKIKIQIGNDKIPKYINLNKNKKIYSNPTQDYDIMVIKLDKGDEIDDIQYLEIDDSLFLRNSERAYEDSSIYILHYPFGNEIRVSYGRGLTMEKGSNFDIIHKCKTNSGSSGSPIFNLATNKIIGIHKCYVSRTNKNDCFNLGTFLRQPFLEIGKLPPQKQTEKLPYKNIRHINTMKINNNIIGKDKANENDNLDNLKELTSYRNLKINYFKINNYINNNKNSNKAYNMSYRELIGHDLNNHERLNTDSIYHNSNLMNTLDNNSNNYLKKYKRNINLNNKKINKNIIQNTRIKEENRNKNIIPIEKKDLLIKKIQIKVKY